MKLIMMLLVLTVESMGLNPGHPSAGPSKFEVTFTNLTHHVVLTPPVFALTPKPFEVFKIGEPAGIALEMLAEGGITDGLASVLQQAGAREAVQTMTPVMPGQSISVELTGHRLLRLSLASMLLPTNDGFVALNGEQIWQPGNKVVTYYLRSFDAGTEENDEFCESIPGPQCGGEGYNDEGGEGHVTPHPGIHGEADLSRSEYNWGEPVAKVTVHPAWN